MRSIIIFLFGLVSCLSAYASQRGVSFEKDGLVYTISSEIIVLEYNIGRKAGEPEYIVVNRGEVYVSGVTVSDSVVKIPTVVSYPSTYCRKDTTVLAQYRVLGIGAKAFEGARLKDLIIPYGLRFIGNEAFHDLEITNGVLAVPPARKMKANIFEGVKSKVLMIELEDTYLQTPVPIIFEKTFERKDNLPDIYVCHANINTVTTGIDKKIFYTVGKNVYKEWLLRYWGEQKSAYNMYRSSLLFVTKEASSFHTFHSDDAPKITFKTARRYDKVGADIDMLPPYEFECRNTYTNSRDTYEEFTMNSSIFRCKKGGKYLYFALDGKPITNIESLLDSSGRDPFGLQVFSKEEIKEKRAAKERESNLNKKVNDLKKAFGF